MVKIKKNIAASTHPPHYMMHKYWGRKPHNVVREYIESYTREGDTVLDPFMGSGVVLIESAKSRRKSLGVDLNPLSCFLANTSIVKLDIEAFEIAFKSIYSKCFLQYSDLYITKCPICSKNAIFENSVWVGNLIKAIKGSCETCGPFKKNAKKFDRELLVKSNKRLLQKLELNEKFVPKDKILQYVKRSQKTHIDQLFTTRALLILGAIREEIFSLKNSNIKNALLLAFSSMLPNVSKMIPGDINTVNGRSGWVVSKLWVPKIHTEKNIFNSFSSRFKKIKAGKMELNSLVQKPTFRIYNQSSENLKSIKSNSVDYIFTDPPYGESIAYFGLSMFFNSWLDYPVKYNSEIIFDPYRDKRHDDYSSRLKSVFKELYRVLKPKKHLSFTFHNRDLKIWRCVIDAVSDAGFSLVNIIYQEQAVQSGTQGLNFKNTFKGDFVYNYIKDRAEKKINKRKSLGTQEIHKKILSQVDFVYKKNKYLTSDKLYEHLIPYVIKNKLYVDSMGFPVELERIVSECYDYKQLNSREKIYGWKKKKYIHTN